MLRLFSVHCRCSLLQCNSTFYTNINSKHFNSPSCRKKIKLFNESTFSVTPKNYSGKCKTYLMTSGILNTQEHCKPKQMAQRSLSNSCVSCGGRFVVTDMKEGSKYYKQSRVNNVKSKNGPKIPPDFRKWESTEDKTKALDRNFKILSYNVLAQYLLESHPYLYSGCNPNSLKWKYRMDLLFNEIIALDPDIICFQEVQVSHLGSFFKKFNQLGYYGVFKRKTGHRQDGCAIYFKESMFTLLDQINVEFYQPSLPILNRDNIGIMVKLSHHHMPQSPFVIATTHLLYNPKRTDVRLAQIQVFLAEIDRFSFSNDNNRSGHLPIVLTGDLNSTPESPVIKLLDQGQVSAGILRDNSDWKRIGVTDNCQHLAIYLNRKKGKFSSDNELIKIHNSDKVHIEYVEDISLVSNKHDKLFNSSVLAHSLQLQSVYDKVKKNGDTEATTFQDNWVTVDYIYYSNSSLRLLNRLRLPTAKECEVIGKLPNEVYASDHIALGATFQMIYQDSKSNVKK